MKMQHGRHPLPPRTSSFQRMLEMEKKIKLDHMQPCGSSESPPRKTSTPKSNLHNENYSMMNLSLGRSAAAPDLSMATFSSPEDPRQISKEVLASPRVLRPEDRDDSDESSICHSPGWDKKSSRGRKQVKREARDETQRQDKERAEREAKLRQPQRRLRKAPPMIKDSKKPGDLYSSANSKSEALSMPIKYQSEKEKEGSRAKGRPRGAMAQNSAVSPFPNKPCLNGCQEGFIGGLKLQQAVYHPVEGAKQDQKARKSKFAEGFTVNDSDQSKFTGNSAAGGVVLTVRSNLLTSSYDEASFPSDEISKTPHTIQLAAGGERIKGSSQGHQFQAPTEESSLFTPLPLAERTLRQGRSTTHGQQPTPSPSDKRPPTSYREPPQLAAAERRRKRRGSIESIGSFLGLRPSSRHGQSTTVSQNEIPSSTKSSMTSIDRQSRGKSWSFYKRSRSSSRPTTASSMQSNALRGSDSDQTSIANTRDEHSSLGRMQLSSKEMKGIRRQSANSTPLQGLKTAAKAVFSRNPHPMKPAHEQHVSSETRYRDSTTISVSESDSAPICNSHSPFQSSSQTAMLSFEEEDRTFTHITQERSPTQPRSDNLSSGHGATSNESGIREVFDGPLPQPCKDGQSSSSSSIRSSSDEYYSISDEAIAASLISPGKGVSSTTTEVASIGRQDGASPGGHSGANHGDGNQEKKYQLEKPGLNVSRTKTTSRSSSITEPSNSTKSSSDGLQDLSFLPTLPHKSLPKGKAKQVSAPEAIDRTPRAKAPKLAPLASLAALPTPPTSSPSSPKLANAQSAQSGQSAQYLQSARQNLPPAVSTSLLSLSSTTSQDRNTLAKMFVICCNCRYYHDMPSKIYECMMKPDSVVSDRELGVSGVIHTAVKCPWCEHGMSAGCCEGWAAVVVLKERLH